MGWLWFGSSITSTDTDGDGFNDRQEFINGTNPNSADPPLQAHSPSPAHGATNVSGNITLSWSNGGAASAYKVYLGTDSTPDNGEYKGQQTGASYVAGTLAAGTTYYWRIDSVNAGGTTTGSVWSFTTKLPPPSAPISPTPADGAPRRSIATNLSWQNGGGATSYAVYFGADATPDSGEFRQTQSGTGYDPGILSYNTTYYWRIDSVNAAGTTAGPVWAFTTEGPVWAFTTAGPPPPVTISFSDFESGWGDWRNILGSDQFDWSRDGGGTPSSGTGPAIDRTLGNSSGYYAYVETSYGSAYNAGDTVILESIPFDADGHQLRLRFYYHMYGANMGTLTVDVFDGTWHLGVWSRSGQQHTGATTPYEEATVDLSSYTRILILRFRVVAAGSYRGDIAIDDIAVIEYFDAPNTQPTIVSSPWADESPTQSQVIGLHVTATDAVGGSLNDQGEAGLTYTWQAVTTPVGAPAPTFSANGSNAAKDTSATGSASGVYIFEVTVSDGAAEVAASVQVEVQFVASLPSLSDFQAGWDDWHNVPGDSNADWLRDYGGTPSYGTGPASDNTLGTTQGYYAYVETSSGDGYQSGRTVILESELLDVQAENLVLRFQYHMYGVNMGALYVDFYDGVWTKGIWSRAGQQQGSNAAPYGMGEASIADVQGLVRFRFRYVTGGGYRGDVALDDLEVLAFDGPPNVTPDGSWLPLPPARIRLSNLTLNFKCSEMTPRTRANTTMVKPAWSISWTTSRSHRDLNNKVVAARDL